MEIYNYSNPTIVFRKARQVFGKNVIIEISDKPTKKYKIYNPIQDKWVYFGAMGYQDFTKHNDLKRRDNYLRRTANMRGEWRNNPYSANNLSRWLLWGG
jgi:hypothetical protein